MKIVERYYWLLISPLYWYVALHMVGYISPVLVDGGGPMPTFYWQRSSTERYPTPSLKEYYENPKWRRAFIRPYWIAAGIITALGCGTAEAVRRLIQLRWRLRSFVTFGATILALMGAAAVSDVVTKSQYWVGPMFYDPLGIRPTFEMIVPISLFAGFMGMVQSRLEKWCVAKARR